MTVGAFVLPPDILRIDQEFFPVALSQLSQRLSDVTVIMAESMESTEVKNEFMAMPAIMGNLENAMLGMQFMANMGDIGELNIAEELISILFKLLNATKDAYATLVVPACPRS